MQFRISAIFLPCFRKSAYRNWLFPLFFRVMSIVFLLYIKHNINHFLSILHMTDQTQAVCSHHGWLFRAKNFVVAVAIVAVVFRSLWYVLFSFVLVPLSKWYTIFWRNEQQICDFLATNINVAEISAFRKNATNIRKPQKWCLISAFPHRK